MSTWGLGEEENNQSFETGDLSLTDDSTSMAPETFISQDKQVKEKGSTRSKDERSPYELRSTSSSSSETSSGTAKVKKNTVTNTRKQKRGNITANDLKVLNTAPNRNKNKVSCEPSIATINEEPDELKKINITLHCNENWSEMKINAKIKKLSKSLDSPTASGKGNNKGKKEKLSRKCKDKGCDCHDNLSKPSSSLSSSSSSSSSDTSDDDNSLSSQDYEEMLNDDCNCLEKFFNKL